MSLQPTNVILKLIFDSKQGIDDITKAKQALDNFQNNLMLKSTQKK